MRIPGSERSAEGRNLSVEAYAELGAELLRGVLWEGRTTTVETAGGPVSVQWQFDVVGEKVPSFFARVRCRYENRQDFWFSLHRKTLFSPLRRLLGPPTFPTAQPDVNQDFLVSTNDRPALNALLADPALRRLLGAYFPLRFELKDDRGWYGNSAPGLIDMLYLETIVKVGNEASLRAAFDLFAVTLNGLARLPARPRRAGRAPGLVQDGPGGPCPTCGELLSGGLAGDELRARIDAELAKEFGVEVERSAWDGPPPDGLLDNLLAWQPAVRQRRDLWQRGRELLAELGGPDAGCPRCAGLHPPGPTHAPVPPARSWRPSNNEPEAPPTPEPRRLAELVRGSAPAPVPPPQPRSAPPPIDPGPPIDSELPSSAPPEPLSGEAQPADAAAPEPAPAGPTLPAPAIPAGPAPASPERAAVDRPCLVVVDGPASVGAAFALTRDSLVIGRSLACDVVLDDRAISYQHARLTRDGDGWLLTDLTGGAQITVNGGSLSGPRHLAHADELRLGGTTIRFESQ